MVRVVPRLPSTRTPRGNENGTPATPRLQGAYSCITDLSDHAGTRTKRTEEGYEEDGSDRRRGKQSRKVTHRRLRSMKVAVCRWGDRGMFPSGTMHIVGTLLLFCTVTPQPRKFRLSPAVSALG
jgi:hypothetical protein